MPRYDVATLTNAPQQERSHALSHRILAAAEKLLRRDGWNGLTIRAVAAESGVTIGGIYRRFSDRDELLQAVHSHVLERLVSRVAKALEGSPKSSLREVVDTFVTSLADGLRESRNIFPSVTATHSDTIVAQAVRAQEQLHAALLAGTTPHRKAIRRGDADLAVRLVLQMVTATLLRRISLGSNFGAEAQDWTVLAAELSVASYRYLTAPTTAG